MTTKDHRTFSCIIFIIMLLLIWLCAGCSFLKDITDDKASKHLRKADKHLKKAVAFGAVINPDTVWKPIAVLIPHVRTDTVFESKQGDTVRIEKERLKIQYVNLPGDSVYIYGESEADTVYRNIPVTVTNDITCPPKSKTWMWIALALGALIVLMFLLRR